MLAELPQQHMHPICYTPPFCTACGGSINRKLRLQHQGVAGLMQLLGTMTPGAREV